MHKIIKAGTILLLFIMANIMINHDVEGWKFVIACVVILAMVKIKPLKVNKKELPDHGPSKSFEQEHLQIEKMKYDIDKAYTEICQIAREAQEKMNALKKEEENENY